MQYPNIWITDLEDGLTTLMMTLDLTVSMYSGRIQREKDRFAEAMTEDISNILKVKKEEVIIVFQEAPHGNWYSSGVRL